MVIWLILKSSACGAVFSLLLATEMLFVEERERDDRDVCVPADAMGRGISQKE